MPCLAKPAFGLEHQVRSNAGCAAWRVGEEDGAVVTHAESDATNFASCSPNSFHFHAWLVCGNFIVDFTTYQLGMKLEALDAMDGQHTTLGLRPDFLVLRLDPKF